MNLGIGGIMIFLAITFVLLQFISRRIGVGFGWDDWVILAALIFACGFLVTTVLVASVVYRGYHFTQYTLLQLEKYL